MLGLDELLDINRNDHDSYAHFGQPFDEVMAAYWERRPLTSLCGVTKIPDPWRALGMPRCPDCTRLTDV